MLLHVREGDRTAVAGGVSTAHTLADTYIHPVLNQESPFSADYVMPLMLFKSKFVFASVCSNRNTACGYRLLEFYGKCSATVCHLFSHTKYTMS